MWFIMLGFDMIVPILLLEFGISFVKKTPNRLKGKYGLRTKQAMRSDRTWRFAHLLCGWIWIAAGAALFIITLINRLIHTGADTETIVRSGIILLLIQIGVMAISVIPVHIALFIFFDRKGEPRS